MLWIKKRILCFDVGWWYFIDNAICHRVTMAGYNVWENFDRTRYDSKQRYIIYVLDLVFGKIRRIASEEVTLQLLKTKCMPILLYSLDVCSLSKRDLQSLDFTVNRFFMKLFNTNNIDVVNYCQSHFGFELPSITLPKRLLKFESVVH